MIYLNSTNIVEIPISFSNIEQKVWLTREQIKKGLKEFPFKKDRRWFKRCYYHIHLLHEDPQEKKYWFRRWQKG